MSRTSWDTSRIPDLTGKTAIVTGATIGLETARALAQKNASIRLAVRNTDKGEAVAQDIRATAPDADVRVRRLDLADLSSVKAFADETLASEERLDFLINNAGVMMPPPGKTKDGFDLQFGTNHLWHFALVGQLLPLLESTPGARIVNVASLAHRYGKLDFNDLNWESRDFNTQRAYSDSKIANLHFTYELARRLKSASKDIRVTAAHPGWTSTDLQRHSGLFQFLNPFFAQQPPQGALPTLRAACDDSAQSGDYFGPKGFMEMRGAPVQVKSSERSHDDKAAAQLWSVSETMTGVSYLSA